MAFKRGNGSVEVELARVQGWVEQTDPELWGRNGDDGVIREHRAFVERQETRDEDRERFMKRMVAFMGILGAIPAALKILEVLHLIPK